MKVHITLVGGQPAPVYHGIVATNPEVVVFIYSKDSHHVLDKLRKEIKISIDEQEPLDATNPELILLRANSLAEKYRSDEITLNISSGLKSWSHIFGTVFDKLPNASVVYMDQNNILWNYRTMKSEDDFQFEMDPLFRLQGNALTHYTPWSTYTEEDRKILDVITAARKYNFQNFNKLTIFNNQKDWANRLEQKKFDTFEIDEKNYIEWEKPNYVCIVLNNKNYGVKEFRMESPNALRMVFSTGWFEYKVARMLSHWRYAKEIRMNCIFPLSNTPNNIKFPKNEIDIIINAGRKMFFVECKTMITSSNDIDKFRTAVKNYGGMATKGLFITDSVMNPLQKEKCKESGLIAFSLQENPEEPNKEQSLFKLLESNLLNINTK